MPSFAPVTQFHQNCLVFFSQEPSCRQHAAWEEDRFHQILSAVITQRVYKLHEGSDGWMYTHGQFLWWVSTVLTDRFTVYLVRAITEIRGKHMCIVCAHVPGTLQFFVSAMNTVKVRWYEVSTVWSGWQKRPHFLLTCYLCLTDTNTTERLLWSVSNGRSVWNMTPRFVTAGFTFVDREPR